MKRTASKFLRRLQVRAAATLLEYTFIIAIVSIAAVIVLAAIGKTTNNLLEQTNSNMP